MKLSTRRWNFCRMIRCASLKDSKYIGVPRECTLEECPYPDKRTALTENRAKTAQTMKVKQAKKLKGGGVQ